MKEKWNDRKNICSMIFWLHLHFTAHLLYWSEKNQHNIYRFTAFYRFHNKKIKRAAKIYIEIKWKRSCEPKIVDAFKNAFPVSFVRLSRFSCKSNRWERERETERKRQENRPQLILRIIVHTRLCPLYLDYIMHLSVNWLTINEQVHFHSFITIYQTRLTGSIFLDNFPSDVDVDVTLSRRFPIVMPLKWTISIKYVWCHQSLIISPFISKFKFKCFQPNKMKWNRKKQMLQLLEKERTDDRI